MKNKLFLPTLIITIVLALTLAFCGVPNNTAPTQSPATPTIETAPVTEAPATELPATESPSTSTDNYTQSCGVKNGPVAYSTNVEFTSFPEGAITKCRENGAVLISTEAATLFLRVTLFDSGRRSADVQVKGTMPEYSTFTCTVANENGDYSMIITDTSLHSWPENKLDFGTQFGTEIHLNCDIEGGHLESITTLSGG